MSITVRDLSLSLFLAERAETIKTILQDGTADGFSDRLSRTFTGRGREDYQRTALNALTLIADAFGGEPKQPGGCQQRS
jgi:hypothetical protein